MNAQRWQDWITALVGAWICVTPWIFGAMLGASMGSAGEWAHYVIGVLVLALALAAIFAYRVWEEWSGAALGLVTIILPWLFGYSGVLAFTLSDILAGLVIVALTGWMAIGHPEGTA